MHSRYLYQAQVPRRHAASCHLPEKPLASTLTYSGRVAWSLIAHIRCGSDSGAAAQAQAPALCWLRPLEDVVKMQLAAPQLAAPQRRSRSAANRRRSRKAAPSRRAGRAASRSSSAAGRTPRSSRRGRASARRSPPSSARCRRCARRPPRPRPARHANRLRLRLRLARPLLRRRPRY